MIQSFDSKVSFLNIFETNRAPTKTAAIIVTAVKTEMTSPNLFSNLKLQRLAYTLLFLLASPQQY
jgi:hypothetical protein